MTAASWGVGRRLAFRFGVSVGVLALFPFPFYVIPKLDWLEQVLNQPMEWAAAWLAEHVLGLPAPSFVSNGSGDTTGAYVIWLVTLILAVLATLVWSGFDERSASGGRRRTAYPRLAAGAWIVLRYYLAYVMLTYGFAKILKSQFPDLAPGRLGEQVGEMSPMGLLWTFMGYSTPYTVFAGLSEAVGGVLLFWRRTVTLGALLIIVVMTNVVFLNFSYDVPVKLYSTQLLLIAIVVLLPSARRLIAVALGHAAAEVPPRPRMSARAERIRLIGKLGFIAMLGCTLYLEFSSRPSRNVHVHELYGSWAVDSFVADGVERPPLADDAGRWRRLALNPRSSWLWRMSGGDREISALVVDEKQRTFTLALYDKNYDKTAPPETWAYTRPAPDRLVLEGKEAGKALRITLHLEPQPLLMTRGFHWINEAPFNR